MKKRVLITGGAGFIGSHTVQALLREGLAVRVLDNLSTGAIDNLGKLLRYNDGTLEFTEGDVRDPMAVKEAMQDVNYVVHLAAQISVQRSLVDPTETEEINTQGTLRLLQESKKAGVQGFVFASSAAVYGNTSVLPIEESFSKQPISPYGVSKLSGEYYCQMFRQVYSLPTVAFRFFNVYGPKQKADSPYASVIPRFLDSVVSGKTPVIFGDGEQSRDFVYVEDVARALSLAVLSASHLNGPYNLCTGSKVTLNGLLDTLSMITSRKIRAVYMPAKQGDIRASQGNPSAFPSALENIHRSFKPTGFEAGLRATWLDASAYLRTDTTHVAS